MRRILFLFFFWNCLFSVNSQVSFHAITDSRQVITGESFQIKFQLNNAEGSQFAPPDLRNFKIIGGPSRSVQTTIINGKMSSSIGYVYELLAIKKGTFNIGQAMIVVNGKKLFSEPVQIEVLQAEPNKQSNAQDVFITASFDKKKAFIGEQILLQYKIYTQINIDGIESVSQNDLKEFQRENINLASEAIKEVYKGKSYLTKILNTTVLYPIKSGKIEIPPLVYKISYSDDDPFGKFSMPSLFSNRAATISSNALVIQIDELPIPKPLDFSGAVGQFQLQTNTISSQFSLHDAISIAYSVTGNGNFNTIEPKLELNPVFEISNYEGTEPKTISDVEQLIKSREIKYSLIPKASGNFKIYPSFCYFDPHTHKYERLKDSFEINIAEGQIQKLTQNGQQESMSGLIESNQIIFNAKSIWKYPIAWILLLLPLAILLSSMITVPSKKSKTQTSKESIPSMIDKIGDKNLRIEDIEKALILKSKIIYENNSLETIKDIKSQFNSIKQNSDQFKQLIYEFDLIKYSGRNDQNIFDDLLNRIKNL